MNHFIAFIALVGFILSLVVHISALFGIDFSDHLPFILVLTIGVFVVYAPFVISSQIHLGERPKFSKIRGLSGHLLFFYFIPFAYFKFRKKSNLPLNSDAPKNNMLVS